MGQNSAIEWTHHTFNPWRGCTKVSAGCANCYAEQLSARNPAVLGEWGPNGTRVIASESYWREPLKWNRAAEAAGERHRVFCASLADVFEPRAELYEHRLRLMELIIETPHLNWLLLTKRPDYADTFLSCWMRGNNFGHVARDLPPNLWIGTSVENQATADERIPHLLQIPAKVRFLSCEPLLGSVVVPPVIDRGEDGIWCDPLRPGHRGIGWVIVGGESGPHARPMHPDWARSLRDQCTPADVPFFFKQWGEWALGKDHPRRVSQRFGGSKNTVMVSANNQRNFPKDPVCMVRVGKKAAGRLLDGRTWDQFPEVRR